MEQSRELTKEEEGLINALIKPSISFLKNWKENILVYPLNDGGMGSLRLLSQKEKRIFGEQVSELEFLDADDVTVIATLYIDDKGQLYELDIWKTDFSKLIRIPDIDL